MVINHIKQSADKRQGPTLTMIDETLQGLLYVHNKEWFGPRNPYEFYSVLMFISSAPIRSSTAFGPNPVSIKFDCLFDKVSSYELRSKTTCQRKY